MASYTSRIFLTLAIPSVFGFLSILFFKRKKITSVESELHTSDILYPINSLKLSNKENICSSKMQLKEKESSEHSSNSNEISHADQLDMQNGETHLENGVSGFTNNVSRQNRMNCQLRDVQTNTVIENDIPNGVIQNNQIQRNGNGVIKFEEQILTADKSVYINGVKRKTKNSLSSANASVLNGNSENNPRLQNGNGLQEASTSNGISNSSRKSKSKKRNKDKQHENSNSCWEEPTVNGCEKDNAPFLNRDNVNELSNGVASLTVNDEAPSLQDQILCCTNSTDMNEDSSVIIGQVTSTITTVVSSTESNGIENLMSNPISVISEETLVKDVSDDIAKECDSVDQISFNNPTCASPESGRSSNSGDIIENEQTDVNEPLTFSVDLVASEPLGDTMLESPDVAYCDSLGSNDSGRGGSDILGYDPPPNSVIYEFDIPSQHCGYLIGKKGNHVNFIKERTNAAIWIRNYPFNKEKKIVTVAGDEGEIQAALDYIRKRFPLKDYPELTLEPSSLSQAEVICPPSLKLALPEGVEFQVVLSATVNAGHFFIQVPTHPSYHALPPFTMSMTALYSHCTSPDLIHISPGNIVASKVGGGWFRAEVVEIFPEEDACNVKYLDYGGYQIVPRKDLRQINIEFMQMPFQATECYLAGVMPHEELGWTDESKMAFETLAQGNILSAYVAGYAEDGIPCLYLYQVAGATNTFINQALVEAGLLRWITYDQ